MARYRKRSDSNWTLSTAAVGWMIAVASILLVSFFFIGIYFGYNRGYDAGLDAGKGAEYDPNEEILLKELQRADLSDDGKGELADYVLQELDNIPEPTADTDNERPQRDQIRQALTPDEVNMNDEDPRRNEVNDTKQANPYEQESDTSETSSEEVDPNEDPMGALQDHDPTSVYDAEDTPEESPVGDTAGSEPAEETGTEQSESTDTDSATTDPEGGANSEEEQATGESDEEFDRQEAYFTIQVMSGPSEQRAEQEADRLSDRGHKVGVFLTQQEEEELYRVRVGTFDSRDQAISYAEDMTEAGEINDFWVSRVTPQ